MNSMERLMNRIEGKPVDHPPNMNILMFLAAKETGNTYGEVIRDGVLLGEGMLRAYEHYHLDCLWAISDSMREPEDLGADVVIPHVGCPYSPVPFIQTAEDLSKLKMVDPYDGPAMYDRLVTVRWLKERAGGEVPVVGWVEGAIASACNFMDVEPFMLFMMDEPEAAKELLAFCCELETKFAIAQVKEGADIIGIGDSVASLIGPKMYREFVYDHLKQMIADIHKTGVKVKLHICGNTTAILEDLVEAEPDILDCDYMVDMAHAGELMRGKGCVSGNFDPVEVMMMGTPQDVYDAAVRCANLAENSIVAAGCEVPLETPPENLLAVHEALCSLG